MDTITRETLAALASGRDTPCVSIYLPLHHSYPQTQEDRLKLAELLDAAETRLADEGLTAAEIRRCLKPACALTTQADFWQPSDARGLALFVAFAGKGAPFFATHRLPYSVPESVDVGKRFHITPLVRLLEWNAHFHLLALGLNHVQLYRCDGAGYKQLDLPAGVPASFEEFAAGREEGRPIQFRSSAATGAGRDQVALVHGQTSYKDDHKDRVKEFVSHIAKKLQHWLEVQNIPLVLAAVDSFHAVFRGACTSSYLVPEGVTGSPDELTEHQMHEQAVQRVAEWQEKRLADFDGHFTSRMAHGNASTDLELIAQAASRGRVGSLLIGCGSRAWGRYDAAKDVATLHDPSRPDDIDLLDFAVAETLTHGGDIHATQPNNVPGSSLAAAILRW